MEYFLLFLVFLKMHKSIDQTSILKINYLVDISHYEDNKTIKVKRDKKKAVTTKKRSRNNFMTQPKMEEEDSDEELRKGIKKLKIEDKDIFSKFAYKPGIKSV